AAGVKAPAIRLPKVRSKVAPSHKSHKEKQSPQRKNCGLFVSKMDVIWTHENKKPLFSIC
ncbi:hypothetical protein ACW3QK_004653, partial [Escherichia coli]